MLDRVYINLGKEFYLDNPRIDFEKLVDEVALCVRNDNNHLFLARDEFCRNSIIKLPCRGYTKEYIAHETTQFLRDFAPYNSQTNMAYYASKRQIKRLVRALNKDHGYISGHALVIIYVMYRLVCKNKSEASAYSQLYKDCLTFIRALAKKYRDDYGNDPVVDYILQCCTVVNPVLDGVCASKNPDDFPNIPRKLY